MPACGGLGNFGLLSCNLLVLFLFPEFGLDELAKTATVTNKAANVKALVREAVQKKHAAEKADAEEPQTATELIAAEPRAKYGA